MNLDNLEEREYYVSVYRKFAPLANEWEGANFGELADTDDPKDAVEKLMDFLEDAGIGLRLL